MNSEYWKEYYKTHEHTDPSEFARWCLPRIRGGYVLDVGCGAGQDTYYFRNNGLEAIGIDPEAPKDEGFHRATFEEMSVFEPGEATVYARWFLHSVPESVQRELLIWTPGQLLVEARVVGDELDDTHWRRPLNPQQFLGQLMILGFDILYFEISRDFSYTNPLLMRVDAEKRAS